MKENVNIHQIFWREINLNLLQLGEGCMCLREGFGRQSKLIYGVWKEKN